MLIPKSLSKYESRFNILKKIKAKSIIQSRIVTTFQTICHCIKQAQ
jgi:hypothetical protein